VIRAGAVVMLLACLVRAAAAQDTSTLLSGDREASAELSRIVETTRRGGLPVDPILAKVRYAVLVAHAPPPRIVAAARAVAARLDEARSALAPHPTPPDIAAGEDALSSGVSRAALQDIRKANPNRPVAVPLGVLAQLVANGVPEKRAAKIVTDLIRRGATAEQLVALGNEINADVALGTVAANALELRTSRLNAVLALPSTSAEASPTSTTIGGPKKP
jgi:hypothetical protein